MQRLRFLTSLSLQSLRSHKLKTAVVGVIVALGTFVMVVGLSFVRSTQNGMRVATSESLTGHIQVWSADAPDEFRLISIGADDPDIGTLQDFSAVEQRLLGVPGVRAAVPLATGNVFSSVPGSMELAVEQLRKAIRSGNREEAAQVAQVVRRLTQSIADGARQERAVAAQPEQWDEKLRIANRFLSEGFWATLFEDPDGAVLKLETELVPIAPAGRMLIFSYFGTDPAQFRTQFSRLRVVDGEYIPEGRRGFMIPKRLYELMMKDPVAKELDNLEKAVREQGLKIAGDENQQSRMEALGLRATPLAAQLDAAAVPEISATLAQHLSSESGDVAELLTQFLGTLDETNIAARHKLFYDTIAPAMRLYAHAPGDDIVLRGFTKNGYVRAVRVKFYGTFEFEGLESSSVASSTEILDLVTARELYGSMSAEQVAELAEIRESVGVDTIGRDSVEDALFGGAAEAESTDPEAVVDQPMFVVPDVLDAADGLEDREYTAAEMRGGVVTSVAVFLDDAGEIETAIEQINRLDGLKATDWKTASGLIGQVLDVFSGILWIAVFFIFLVALVVLNNSTLMATMERFSEIGTLRALGGQRRDILVMVFIENALTAFVGALLGSAVGAAVVLWLGTAGIPAPAPAMRIVFGGERLYLALDPLDVVLAVVLAVVVTLISALHPARLAANVPPVVAMRGKA